MTIKIITFIAAAIMVIKFVKSTEKISIGGMLADGFVLMALATIGRFYL